MSASPATADACATCGASLPRDARFCPACGTPAEAGETVKAPVPPEETGPVPVSLQRTEPHWFGVTPPNLLIGIAVAALVLAIVLFATGNWPFGLILLGVGALLLAAFLEAARRRPESQLTRASVDARERARSSWETLRARQAAATEIRRIQTAIAALEPERRAAFHELGIAAYRQDPETEKTARGRLTSLDNREAELRTELDKAQADAGERIRRARLPVDETVISRPPDSEG